MGSIPKEFDPPISAPNYLIRKHLLKNIILLAPNLKGKLLDFGCGQKPYRSVFTVDEYVGLDFENSGHSHTNESIDVYYDGQTIPFENEHFDSIFSSEVFEHIFNLETILKELNRVLKVNGTILITCPFCICEHEVPNDFARYSSFAIKYLMEKNGFIVTEQLKSGNSIETIIQTQLIYIHQHLYPKLKKIPIIRSLFRIMIYSSANAGSKLLSILLPKGKDLYLNNILLCKKQKNLSS